MGLIVCLYTAVDEERHLARAQRTQAGLPNPEHPSMRDGGVDKNRNERETQIRVKGLTQLVGHAVYHMLKSPLPKAKIAQSSSKHSFS